MANNNGHAVAQCRKCGRQVPRRIPLGGGLCPPCSALGRLEVVLEQAELSPVEQLDVANDLMYAADMIWAMHCHNRVVEQYAATSPPYVLRTAPPLRFTNRPWSAQVPCLQMVYHGDLGLTRDLPEHPLPVPQLRVAPPLRGPSGTENAQGNGQA